MYDTEIEIGAGRDIWVKALRSGEYEQTVSQLERNGAFCCLGVACEVAKQEGVIAEYNGDFGDLTSCEKVARWINVSPKAMYLIGLNDVGGRTFPEIADAVGNEKTYDEYAQGH